MAIRRGLVVGSWEVLGRINAGGMASVWKVRHTVTGRERALKALHDHVLQDDPRGCQRFLDEARNTEKVEHPNVVRIIDAGVFPDPDADQSSTTRLDTPWLVMELLDGHDLSVEMKERGARGLPRERVADIIEQIGAGLHAAHARGVVHFDLKPENLFLARSDGREILKIVDFGISKAVGEGRKSITMTRRMMSAPWTSPEQIIGRTGSAASDVWALGLVAFHLLTGRYYWRSCNEPIDGGGDPALAIVNEIVTALRAPARASDRAAEYRAADRLPPEFDAWFARVIVEEPGARPTAKAACEALLAMLRPRVSGSPIPPTEMLRATPMPPRDTELMDDVAAQPRGVRSRAPRTSTTPPGAGAGRSLSALMTRPWVVFGAFVAVAAVVVTIAESTSTSLGDGVVAVGSLVVAPAVLFGSVRLPKVIARAVRSRSSSPYLVAIPALLIVVAVVAGLGAPVVAMLVLVVVGMIIAVRMPKVISEASRSKRPEVARSDRGR